MGIGTSSYNNLKPCSFADEVEVCTDNCGKKYYSPKYSNVALAKYGIPLQGYLSPNNDRTAFDPTTSITEGGKNYLFKIEWPFDSNGDNSYIIGGAEDFAIGPLPDETTLNSSVIYFDCPGVYTLTATVGFSAINSESVSSCNEFVAIYSASNGFLEDDGVVSTELAVFAALNDKNTGTDCTTTATIQKTFIHGVTIGPSNKKLTKGIIILQGQTSASWKAELVSFSLVRYPGQLSTSTPLLLNPPTPTPAPSSTSLHTSAITERLRSAYPSVFSKKEEEA